MKVKKHARPSKLISSFHGIAAGRHIPTGANSSWSNATRFIAGTMAAVLVMGNVLDKNPNHLCCIGAIKKPYDINLVRRSKSNGGGNFFESGMRSVWENGFLRSSSWISMARKSSLSPFRTARCRIAVKVCATVSAMPPNICTCISF